MKFKNKKKLSPVISSYSKNNWRLVPKRINEDWLKNNQLELYNEILHFTQHEIDISIRERVILFLNNLPTIPFCETCKSEKIKIKRKYLTNFCSISCAQKSPKIQEKITQTNIKKFGVSRYFGEQKKEFDIGEHHTQKHITNIVDVHDKEFMNELILTGWKNVAVHFNLTTKSHSSTFNFLRKFGYEPLKLSGNSNLEIEVYDFVNSIISSIPNSKKIISPYELDIFVKEKNIGIEFNGLYYHSFNQKETIEEKNYHLMKTKMCENVGIKLFHIFENEWNNHQDIWKSMIRNSLGVSKNKIYARNCYVTEIDNEIYKSFCVNNHLQGYCNSLIRLGLFEKNTKSLLGIMSFSKSRFDKQYEYEMIRFCNKINYSVIGGFSKMLKYFENHYSPKSIISFGNRRWCFINDNVYRNNGFSFINETAPNYFYVLKGEVFTRQQFQKHKLKNKLKKFNNKLTEYENMFNNGYRRIWDSGNLKYGKKYENTIG